MTRKWAIKWYFRGVVNTSRRPVASRGKSPFKIIGVLLIALLGMLYWWWSGLVGAGDPATEPAVLVVGNGDLKDAQTVVSRRLIEEGLTVAWADAPTSWCDVPQALAENQVQPTRGLVIALHAPQLTQVCSVAPEVTAAAVSDALKAYDVSHIAVVAGLSGESDPVVSALHDLGIGIVDPTPMLAGVDEHVDCLWWDDCVPDENGIGYVIVRDSQGLTLVGQQRVARMIVASML